MDITGWQEIRVITSAGEVISIGPHGDADSNDDLLHRAALLKALVDELSKALSLTNQQLADLMKTRGAREYVSSAGSARIRNLGVRYDPNLLDALLELIPEHELVQSGALVPAHDKVVHVSRKWYIAKLRPFVRRGREIDEIIQRARIVGKETVDIVAQS